MYVYLQARIHTGFHRFTEIGHIFIINMFLKIKRLSKLPSGQYFVWLTWKPTKGDFKE